MVTRPPEEMNGYGYADEARGGYDAARAGYGEAPRISYIDVPAIEPIEEDWRTADAQHAADAQTAASAQRPSSQRASGQHGSGQRGESKPKTRTERLSERFDPIQYEHPRSKGKPDAAAEGEEPAKPKRTQRAKELAYEKTPDRFKNASSFQVRLRTGAVYVGLSILLLLINDFTTMILLAATAAVCAGEFYYMLRADAKMPNEVIGIIAAALYPISTFAFGIRGPVYTTVLLVLALMVWYVYNLRTRIADIGVCMFGAVYTGFQLSGLMLVRMCIEPPWGGVVLLIIFVSIWGNDAFAYLAGSKFGRHKLAPRTSPNKSWEGFGVGLLFSMVWWCLMLLVPAIQIDLYQALLFGLICGLVSVVGDLCESRIKRSVGFKDSGTIMPGHGGLFDRCDSLMPTSLVVALLLFAGGCIPLPF